jgi:class 3 adenylate cyclase
LNAAFLIYYIFAKNAQGMRRVRFVFLSMFLTLTFLFSLNSEVRAQFDDKSRAEYIFDVIRYVTWPNENSIDSFRIAVLTKDSSLYSEMCNLARVNKTHEKPVAIRWFTSINDIKPVQAIFLRKESGFDIDQVLWAIKDENTLLISENFEFHKSMINFIVINNKKRFELNMDRMTQEGFAVTVTFAALAVQKESDWKALYNEVDLELQQEKHVVEEQKQLLEKQKNEIIEQTMKIVQLNADIIMRQEQIDWQKKELDAQKIKLADLILDVVKQQKLIDRKIHVLDSQNLEIMSRNNEINAKKEIIDAQDTAIQKQQSRIKTQNELIDEQKAKLTAQGIALGLFIVLLLVSGVLIFFVYRSYKVKKESNIKLQEKNVEIIKQKDIIQHEKDRSEKLLLNILPVRVAEDLKQRGKTEPQVFKDVTVFFSDIVGFTRQSSHFGPQLLIDELNDIFTAFDNIIERNSCERIKTIGDAYLAVCGMPTADPNHAENMMKSAIEILHYLAERNSKSEIKWEVRVGLHSGEVVGGVVGVKKYIYDVFGDTINTASRMESNSEPMQINVSEATYNLLKDKYEFVTRDLSEIKGKGKMNMYFLKEEITDKP